MNTQEDPKDCLAAALRLLARRDHSRWELAKKLADRGFNQHLIEWALSECSRLNYQDDERYARAYTRHLQSRGYGCHRIKQMLTSKGLAPPTISAGLKICCREETQLQNCRRALLKKIKNSPPADDGARSRERLYRFLFNRGYSPAIIRQAMDEGLD